MRTSRQNCQICQNSVAMGLPATGAPLLAILTRLAGAAFSRGAQAPRPSRALRPLSTSASEGSIVEFPAGTPTDLMTRAMRQRFGAPETPPTPTLPENLVGPLHVQGRASPGIVRRMANAAGEGE